MDFSADRTDTGVDRAGRMSFEIIIIVLLGALLFFALIIIVLITVKQKTALPPASSAEEQQRQLSHLEKIQADLEQLSQLFLVPHTRGGVGETLLEELLKNWLPQSAFSFQYPFEEGHRADAVIKLGRYLVAVDAKFPLESVRSLFTDNGEIAKITGDIRRSVIRHMDTIREKYIRPKEQTLQFALMYIPSERVYYHLFVQDENGELLKEALARNVVPAGPSNLFLYLQTVAYGFRGFALSEKQELLLGLLNQLGSDFSLFAKSFSVTGTHVKNLWKSYEELRMRFRDMERTLERIQTHELDH